jgi:hypothetical protein
MYLIHWPCAKRGLFPGNVPGPGDALPRGQGPGHRRVQLPAPAPGPAAGNSRGGAGREPDRTASVAAAGRAPGKAHRAGNPHRSVEPPGPRASAGGSRHRRPRSRAQGEPRPGYPALAAAAGQRHHPQGKLRRQDPARTSTSSASSFQPWTWRTSKPWSAATAQAPTPTTSTRTPPAHENSRLRARYSTILRQQRTRRPHPCIHRAAGGQQRCLLGL